MPTALDQKPAAGHRRRLFDLALIWLIVASALVVVAAGGHDLDARFCKHCGGGPSATPADGPPYSNPAPPPQATG